MTQTPSTEPEKRNSGLWILVVLAILILIMASVATWQLSNSMTPLREGLEQMKVAGKTLDVNGCIQETRTWRDNCSAMSSLCDNSLGQMLDTCLSVTSREEFCSTHTEMLDTHSKNDRCIELGFSRKSRAEWKRCGMILEGLEHHCRLLRNPPSSRKQ